VGSSLPKEDRVSSEPTHEPGAPSDYTTLVEVLAAMAADGYAANVTVTEDGLLRCPACGTDSAPRQVSLDAMRRLEGASEPDEMQAALAVRCPTCATRGAVVVHFDPQSTAAESAVLNALVGRR
jgi:hypothetical protein